MPQHIIFLLHGMGQYGKMEDGKYKPDENGWFKDAKASLRTLYDRFIKDEIVGEQTFDERFKIVEVEYESIMERFRFAWDKQAEGWSQLGFNHGVAGALTDFFQGNDATAFLWTHVADVGLYLAPTVRVEVKTKVAANIFKALAAEQEAQNLDGWSVIAHSLGSAVAHDTLTDVRRMLDDDPAMAGGVWPPRTICMAANVSHVLTEDRDLLYSDILAPTGGTNPSGYISCNHRLDPFTLVAPFAPDRGAWIEPSIRYRDLTGLSDYYLVKEVVGWAKDAANFEAFAAVVPHGFEHYMRQPRVVATLWPALLGKAPSATIEATVREAYRADLREQVKAAVSEQLAKAIDKVKADVGASANTPLGQVGGSPLAKLLGVLGGLA
jgi:hypothetical protein